MLVERDAQLAALRSAVGSSAGKLVLIAAEAGAGKTALIRRIIDDCRPSADARCCWVPATACMPPVRSVRRWTGVPPPIPTSSN